MRLVLKEFALKFDEFDTPLETVDLRFDFNRRIEKWKVEKDHETVSFDRQ